METQAATPEVTQAAIPEVIPVEAATATTVMTKIDKEFARKGNSFKIKKLKE
ncbi:MAG: hypothetical protein IJ929_02185 [Prevotella sp.]|nr:hypothetical protein [Prevotella sp.]